MSCPAQTFTVSPTQFATLAEKAREENIDLSSNQGSSTQDGVTVSWNYDPAGQTLVLECTAKPMFVPCSMVNAKLQQLVAEALA